MYTDTLYSKSKFGLVEGVLVLKLEYLGLNPYGSAY